MRHEIVTETVHGLLARGSREGGYEWETLAGWQVSARIAVDAIGHLEDHQHRFVGIPSHVVQEAVESVYRLYLAVQDEMPENCDDCGWGLDEDAGAFGVIEAEPVRWCWDCAEDEHVVSREQWRRAWEGEV